MLATNLSTVQRGAVREFTEAELLAFDRGYALAKDSGLLQADADRRALSEQVAFETLAGGAA